MDTFRRPPKPFGEFFAALVNALGKEGVRYCILRNYELFPAVNAGNDIDILISAKQLPEAVRALRSIRGVRIVGYTERPFVANVFLEGIAQTTNPRALQVDFDLLLPWKGLPFLKTDIVLQAVISRTAGSSTFFVPSPIYEAIASLFTSLVIGGQLKEKYFPDVQRTFAGDRPAAIAALQPQFARRAATRLVDAVIEGDREKVLGCVKLCELHWPCGVCCARLFEASLRSFGTMRRNLHFGFRQGLSKPCTY